MATILEHCQIHPLSPCTHQELSLPLTHFDIPFLLSDPAQRLYFYNFPCSKSHFLKTIIPNLKKSLAITISHFLPAAGNIILPSNSGLPFIRYGPGDSVSLTIAQCDKDFNYLAQNHQRVADEFYSCVPELPPARKFPDNSVSFRVLATQITLFPGQGICIGITVYHAINDEISHLNFMKAWAFTNTFRQMDGKFMPNFDRTLVQDKQRFDFISWNSVKKYRALPVQLPHPILPTNRVRNTFIVTKNEVQKLKNYILANKPNISYISSFSVICAYVWTCSIKSWETMNEDETVHFACPADCRARLVPPLPTAYFGNCVIFVISQSTCGLLRRNDGFLIAAETIGEAIKRTLYSENGILESANWPIDFEKFDFKRLISVAGSPRFDVYEVDYGWGRPIKHEFVHLDREDSISVAKSREFEGGFEIGLSRTKSEMDAFEGFFHRGLETMIVSAL